MPALSSNHLPSPPKNLNELNPLFEEVTGTWYRVTRRDYSRDVHYFSESPSNRFSSPSADFGVSYYGSTPETTFAECVRGGALIDPNTLNGPVLEILDLHEVTIKASALPGNRAIALRSTGCARIRARAECFCLSHPEGYRVSQEWARALMKHPAEHSGLLYQANYAADLCLGLYGKKSGIGAKARKAKGLELRKVRSLRLLESNAFLQWVEDCHYVVARPQSGGTSATSL